MAEYRSPLTTAMTQKLYGGLSASAGVTLSEKPIGGLAQFAGWEAFSDVILQTFDLLEPLAYNTTRSTGGFTLYRIAPTRVQVHHAEALELLEIADQIDMTQAGFVDLSHARCRLCLSGAAAEKVLQRIAPLDFDLTIFPVGGFYQSGIHHIPVLFHRTDDQEFDLFIPTTWAVSIFEYLYDAALSYGINIMALES
ncbi:hypothetical protein WH96_05360 [Kiloniella spongiae]|uniref:Sarcosine oxidase subunit gamma n=1 Tax=Kiloniella spongiae TaxID=1489064 RepID=A0A0H2MGM0_9PROT|nr:hypothetical protein [Kiloniella spongiae]KLN61734.1 hypothetical protein WH96_05360 [Kiloniella spongiae]